jgi:hypothetical protein
MNVQYKTIFLFLKKIVHEMLINVTEHGSSIILGSEYGRN